MATKSNLEYPSLFDFRPVEVSKKNPLPIEPVVRELSKEQLKEVRTLKRLAYFTTMLFVADMFDGFMDDFGFDSLEKLNESNFFKAELYELKEIYPDCMDLINMKKAMSGY
jgi:hypothetical protein